MLQPHSASISPLVFQPIDDPQPNRQPHRHHRRHNNRNFRRPILGRIPLPKRLRPNNIPQAKTHQQHRIHNDFFRVARVVGRDPAVQQWEAGADAVGHVIADKLAGFCVGGEVGNEDGAEHAGEEEHADAKGALIEAAGNVGGGDDGDDGDGARGDGEQGGLFGGVAEAVGGMLAIMG